MKNNATKSNLLILSVAAIFGLASCGGGTSSAAKSDTSSTGTSSAATSVTTSAATSAASSGTSSAATSQGTSSEPGTSSEASSSPVSSSETTSIDTKVYTDANWTSVGDAKSYYYDGGKIICNVQEDIGNGKDHFIYTHTNYDINNTALGANYKLSVHYVGSYAGDVVGETYAGLIAWWQDANNYIVFATRWADWDRPAEIRSLFITGMIAGQPYALSDIWTDNCGVASADGVDLAITKTGTKFDYDLRGDNHAVKTGSVTIAGTASSSAQAGILGANDVFQYTAYSGADYTPETKSTYTNVDGAVTYTLILDSADTTYTLAQVETGKDTINSHGTYVLDGRNVTLNASDGTVLHAKLNSSNNSFVFYTPSTPVSDATVVDGTSARAYHTIKENMTGDYNLEYDFLGTYTDSGHAVKVGLNPWYVDEDNYIDLYVEWSASERSQEIREVQLTGKIGGTAIGYNDGWCDGCGLLDSDGFHLLVNKVGNAFTYTLTSGTFSKSNTVTVTQMSDTTGTYLSRLYAEGDKISFSNITFFSDVSAEYTVTPDTVSNAVLRSDYFSLPAGTTVMKKAKLDDDYKISYHFAGTMNANVTTEVQMGVYAWYLDENNFVKFYVQWSATDRPQEIRECQITGKVNGTDLGWHDFWCDGSSALPADGFDLVVSKTGTKIAFSLTSGTWNKTDSLEVASLPLNTAFQVGFYTLGDAFKMTKLSIDSSIAVAAGASHTYKSGLTGDYTMTMDFAGTFDAAVSVESIFGFQAWYVDADNYLNVYVQWSATDRPTEIREIQVVGKVAGADTGWHDVWCDGSAKLPADGFTLTVAKVGGAFTTTLTSGSWSKTDAAYTIAGIASSTAAYAIGYYAVGDNFTVSNHAYTAA